MARAFDFSDWQCYDGCTNAVMSKLASSSMCGYAMVLVLMLSLSMFGNISRWTDEEQRVHERDMESYIRVSGPLHSVQPAQDGDASTD